MQILDFDGNGSEVGAACPDSDSKTRQENLDSQVTVQRKNVP